MTRSISRICKDSVQVYNISIDSACAQLSMGECGLYSVVI